MDMGKGRDMALFIHRLSEPLGSPSRAHGKHARAQPVSCFFPKGSRIVC